MDQLPEFTGSQELVHVEMVSNGVIEESVSVTSSKRKRSKSIETGSYKSFSSMSFSDDQQSVVSQMHGQLHVMEEKLSGCIDQQNMFRETANQLVEEVRESIISLNKNQAQQQASVDDQKSQIGELIEQTKKLILQCGDSARDLKNQQSSFTQQFVQMKQWQTDVEKELQKSVTDRMNLISHAQDKQTESQWMKEQLQTMRNQNRDRVTHLDHGGSSTMLGGNTNAFGGSSGSTTKNAPSVAPKAFLPTEASESNDPKTSINAGCLRLTTRIAET